MAAAYKRTMDAIYSLANSVPPRQYLGGMRKLLSELGNPQKNFESLLVSGTNGKGSVVAMTSSALAQSGFRTGRYLSPHIDRFEERICINNREITGKRLAELYETVSRASQRTEPVSFFEFVTSMAFQYFSEEDVGFAVLEVGMGGRLDATNASKSSSAGVVSIGIDHARHLGPTISSIAGEKSGVIRKGGFVVTAEQKPGALRVLRAASRKAGATLAELGRDVHLRTISCTEKENRYAIAGMKSEYGVSLSMLGAHQGKNAAVAAVLSERAGASHTGIEKGISAASLPCRLEITSRNPTTIMDCAHNPHAARALSSALGLFRHDKLVLVLGMMGDKDMGSYLAELSGAADIIVVNEPRVARAAKLYEIYSLAREHKPNVVGVKDVRSSLQVAKSLAGSGDLVCMAGSIYMLSEARGNTVEATG